MRVISSQLETLSQKLKSQLGDSEKVYIIPTRFGLAFFSVNFISFVIALAFGHQFSYIFSISLLVTFVTSAMITNQYMKNINIRPILNYSIGEEGDEILLPVSIENKEEQVIDLNLKTNEEFKKIHSNNEVFETNFIFKNEKVGIYQSEKFRLNTTYPLFLFKAWKTKEIRTLLLIYPKSHFFESREHYVDKEGIHEIEHVKYVEGDNLSKIDWKIYARKNELFSKIDLGEQSNINIIDESIILKHGTQGLGYVCKLIHQHIDNGHSFIFKYVTNKEGHFSKVSHMVNLMRDLLRTYHV